MLGQNRFAQPNQHVLTFLHPILICRVTDWAPVELLIPTGALTLYYTLGCQDSDVNKPVRTMKVSWLSNHNKCKSKRERQKEPPVVASQYPPHVLPNSQNLQFQHLCCLLPLLTWLNSKLSRRPAQLPRAQLQVKYILQPDLIATTNPVTTKNQVQCWHNCWKLFFILRKRSVL